MRTLYLFLTALLSTASLQAQDVSQFGNKNAYGLSGSLNVGGNFYETNRESTSVYAPYGYQVSGNITAKLGAISVPLQFTFNQTSNSLSSPFNLYGASPQYKWVKVHLGYRNLAFSPYVYNGRSFLGAGIELTPGKFNFTAFRGKLKNLLSIRQAELNQTEILPSYDRWITGARIGFGQKTKFELLAVHVKDNDEGQVDIPLSPAENIVLGSKLKITLFNNLSLNASGNVSLLTADINASGADQFNTITEQTGELAELNFTSRASWAGDADISYRLKQFNVGLFYKRINPYYQSLATNYLQNDIEQLTFKGSLPLMKNAIRIDGSIGRERDNLENNKGFTSVRTIGSLGLSYRRGHTFHIQGRYNNYQTENESGLYVVNDSVRVLTTTSNIMLSSFITLFTNEELEGKLTFNVFNNRVIDDTQVEDLREVFDGKGSYASLGFNFIPIQFTIGPVVNYSRFISQFSDQRRTGFGINASKAFFDSKLMINGNALYNFTKSEGEDDGYFLSFSFQTRYIIAKDISANFRLNNNSYQGIISQSFNEWRGYLGISYRWNLMNKN